MRTRGAASQEWSARRYAETAHFVPALGAPVLELLAPSAGERIRIAWAAEKNAA